MAKVLCRKCGDECCDCLGCNTRKYKEGLCPHCQKIENNANTTDNRMQELRQPEGTSTVSGVQSSELSKK